MFITTPKLQTWLDSAGRSPHTHNTPKSNPGDKKKLRCGNAGVESGTALRLPRFILTSSRNSGFATSERSKLARKNRAHAIFFKQLTPAHLRQPRRSNLFSYSPSHRANWHSGGTPP